MELIYILLISIFAAALSLLPVGRRFAPAVTLLGTLAVFLLSLRVALATITGGEVVALRDWLSCDSLAWKNPRRQCQPLCRLYFDQPGNCPDNSTVAVI
jgi:hypothetical protein